MNNQALLELGMDVAIEMQNQLVAFNAIKTGTLYRSINVYEVNNNMIAIEMEDYGQFVNSGHATRLGTSQNPKYKPSPLHTQAFVAPRPFIDNALKQVVDAQVETYINKILP